MGITRSDFDLTERNIKIQPTALILVSSVTDPNHDAIKRNGVIRKNTGYKCNLQTSTGTIECVRYTGNSVLGSDGVTKYPELEYFTITETIDDNGVADGYFTNEYGIYCHK